MYKGVDRMVPKFKISSNMMRKAFEISQIINDMKMQVEKDLKLRKENRIQSIQSSLAIESNSLSIEQVTDIINGKRVLGNLKEIREVKNANDAYEEILQLNPYDQSDFLKVHGLLTKGLVNESGQYRSKDVGIFDGSGNLVHMGARPQFIRSLMDELFEWGSIDDTPEFIKSCIFHYEIEMIHPFEDGNGRMGRLWQTIILASWNPIFAWVPIETGIHENQKAYYQALAESDKDNDLSSFIEFMLSIILDSLQSYVVSITLTHKKSSDMIKEVAGMSEVERQLFILISKYLKTHDTISTNVAVKLIDKSAPTVRRYLSMFVKIGLLEAHGSNKNRTYSLKRDE